MFSPIYGLSFHFIDGVFWSTKFYNFDEVSFICFYFYFVSCVWTYVKKHCLIQGHKDLYLFSSKNFIVLTDIKFDDPFWFFVWLVWRNDLTLLFCISIPIYLSTIPYKDYTFPIKLSTDHKCKSLSGLSILFHW